MKRAEVKRQDLAKTLAERSSLSAGQAQDELDRVVHDVVTSLRQGQPTEMPGVGHMLTKPMPAKIMTASRSMKKPSPAKPFTRSFRKSAARKP
jgi:nucleoid DNA-binding protein